MNNCITLAGRVVKDPIKKSIPAKNTSLAEFSIAVKDYSKKGMEDDGMYFDVKAFNGNVDKVVEYIAKGREIVIFGRVSVESYTRNDGGSVTKYVVILNGFHLCGSKLDVAETSSESGASTESTEETADKSAE